MHNQPLRFTKLALAAGLAILAISTGAIADPPSRIARLGAMTGAVSFSPAGENDWVQATINRPLTTGDRLWADAGSRAEIEVGGGMIRMGAGTGVSVLNLDDQITQLQLSQGSLNVRVRGLGPGQAFEVDTPNLAFTLRQPGAYRIDVDPDGNATTIVVRNGQGEVYGEDASYVIDSRQAYRFAGTGLRDYQLVGAPGPDEFDRWAADRDRRYDTSVSLRYVSADVVGYQDLDANGTWRADPSYGNVWIPNRVAAGWAPYHDGHWAWVDPWGWTWVDDAPWGFAVSHYGRWANLGGTWGWVPGPRQSRAYYAPALVAFVGGSNFQIAISSGNVGGIAWFPLGPRDVYRPSYTVSRGYFENVNRSNTVINTTVINNYYNNTNVTNVVYANRQVPGAVIAVPTTAFVQSQPVTRAAVRVTPAMVSAAPVAVAPSVAPTERSVRGATSPGEKAPPQRVFERPVVAHAAPPAAPVSFAAQQQQLAAKPGKPLDDATRRELKPAAAAPAAVVKVATPTQVAPPTVRPPPTAPGAKPLDARGKGDEGKSATAPPAMPATPPAPAGAPPKGAPPVQATPPAPAGAPPKGAPPVQATPPAPAGAPPKGAPPVQATPPVQGTPPATVAQPPEPRGKAEQRGPPPAPAGAPPKGAPPIQATPPVQGTPPATVAQPPESRGKPEQRGPPPAPRPTLNQGGTPPVTTAPAQVAPVPVAPPPPPPSPQRVAPVPAAPPQAAPPPPVAQPPDQRGKSESRGNAEQRGQPATPPPPPRPVEPRVAPAPSVAPTPPPPPPPQAGPPPKAGPPPQAAPAQPMQPPPQAAAPPKAGPPPPPPPPPAAAPKPPPPQAQPVPRGQENKPAAGKPDDKGKSPEQLKKEEEERKQKG